MDDQIEAICGVPADSIFPADAVILAIMLSLAAIAWNIYQRKRRNTQEEDTNAQIETGNTPDKALCPACLHENLPEASLCEQCHAPIGMNSDISRLMQTKSAANRPGNALTHAMRMALLKSLTELLLMFTLIMFVFSGSPYSSNPFLSSIFVMVLLCLITFCVPMLMAFWKIPKEPNHTQDEDDITEDEPNNTPPQATL